MRNSNHISETPDYLPCQRLSTTLNRVPFKFSITFCVSVIIGLEIAMNHHVDKVPWTFGTEFYKKR